MSTRSGSASAFAAIPLWLAFVIGLPFAAIVLHPVLPRTVANFAFFAPQYLFSFGQIVRPVEGGFASLFNDQVAGLACLLLWSAATIAFGLLARRAPRRVSFLLAPLALVLVTAGFHLVAGVFGYTLQLDGP
jgi:hypothetical protein